jgi:hypothetical protein
MGVRTVGAAEQQRLIESKLREVDLTKTARARGSRKILSSCLVFTSGMQFSLSPLLKLTVFTNCRTQLLKLALPLVQHHGFTRTALARSVLDLPEPHAEPLSDSAVTMLFGDGDTARRTLISAWFNEGRAHMRSAPVDGIKGALLARLEYNAPVLGHLPEVSLH